MITLELTEEDIGYLRGAIDHCVRQGGMQAARQLLGVDDKIVKAFEAFGDSQKDKSE
jgi:hypothetical protein